VLRFHTRSPLRTRLSGWMDSRFRTENIQHSFNNYKHPSFLPPLCVPALCPGLTSTPEQPVAARLTLALELMNILMSGVGGGPGGGLPNDRRSQKMSYGTNKMAPVAWQRGGGREGEGERGRE
jgi:hypothetical protein